MTTRHVSNGLCSTVMILLVAGLAASSAALAQAHSHGGSAPAAHQHLDSHFGHNQYYLDHGHAVHGLPAGGYRVDRGGERYWYHGGHWYHRGGFGWAVDGAPFGAFVWFLPAYYTTVWYAGVPYYYANDTYYAWNDPMGEYEVVQPPPDIESAGTTQPPFGDTLYVYPKNGQSNEQQAKDRFECHQSAAGQSGYDPTKTGGGAAPDAAAEKRMNYLRAQAACLDARGYSVK